MQPFTKSLIRLYFTALCLIGLGILLRRLFGDETHGPWWLWVAAVPATIALILSLPVLIAQIKNRH
jgi:hypothetical protein